jgi:hypothetical protein
LAILHARQLPRRGIAPDDSIVAIVVIDLAQDAAGNVAISITVASMGGSISPVNGGGGYCYF